MTKYLKPIFLLLGALLLAWAIRHVDISAVGHLIAQTGYGFLLILTPFFLVTVAHTIAWKYAFKPQEIQDVKLWELWRIRQIGEAFNTITPLGTVGGEPVKAQLLKERHSLSLKQGLASGVVTRTTNLMALTIFLVGGTVLIFGSSLVSQNFKHASLAGLVVFSTMILLFLLFQLKGGLNVLASWFSKLPFGGKIQNMLSHLEILSRDMSGYYRKHPNRCGKSIFYMLAGWVVGIMELYVILYFIGHPLSFTELWIIEALLQLIRAGSFFIPLSLGAQESGLVVIFVAMGMTANLGLAVSLIRRIKDLVWVGGGLMLGWTLAFRAAKARS
ncbi:MAG: flippase-like domain-containing protein [Nitrospinales bacterium]